MTILNHLAQAAAIILLIELMVVVIIFLAVAGGVAFGLHWVRSKLPPVFDKINTYVPLGAKYVHVGTDYIALPFIRGGQAVGKVAGTAEAIRTRVQAGRTAVAEPEPRIFTAPTVEEEPAAR